MSTGSAQQTSTTTAGVSPFAQNYVDAMLGAGQQQVFNMAPGADGKMNITGIKPYVPFGAPMDAQGNVAQYQGGQPQGMGWGAYGGQQQPPQMGFGPAPNNFTASGAGGTMGGGSALPPYLQQKQYGPSGLGGASTGAMPEFGGGPSSMVYTPEQAQRDSLLQQLNPYLGAPDAKLRQPMGGGVQQGAALSYFNTPAALRGRFAGTDDSGMGAMPGAGGGPSSMVYTPEQARRDAYLNSINPNARQQREAQMRSMGQMAQKQNQYGPSQLDVGEQPLVSMMGHPDLSQLAQPAYDDVEVRIPEYDTWGRGFQPPPQQPSTGYAPGTMQAGMGPGEQLAARSSVAGPSALQQQAYGAAAGMQTPGQYGQATDIGQAAGLGLLNTAGQAQGLQSLAQQAIQQGRQYGQDITNPYRTQAFMSPYMQNVVDIQQREARRASDIAAQAQKGQAVQSGAFGGSRQGVVEAERQRNLATQLGDIQAQGLQSAFQNAQQQQLNAQNQAMQGYGTGIQGYGAGITGQTGAYGAASQGAGTLGALGGQQLNAQQSIANLQNTFGQQQQQNQQQIINQAMQNYQMQRMYPQQQLSYLGSLLSGLPVSSAGQVTNIPAPSLVSQLGGLGIAGAGAYGLYNNLTRKKGGTVRAPARGGNGLMDVALNKLGA